MPDCAANSAAADLTPVPGSGEAGGRVRVLLPLPLAGPLDYRAVAGEPALEPGRFVRVTLGPRQVVGVVWDGDGEDVDEARLKPVGEILPTPALPEELRRFVDRVAAYTLAPPGAVLRMTMSIEAALTPPAPRRVCAITEAGRAVLGESPAPKALTAPRRRALETLRDTGAASAAETARQAGVGAAVVRGLVVAGYAAEHLAP